MSVIKDIKINILIQIWWKNITTYNDLQEIFHNKNEIGLFLINKTLYYYNLRKRLLDDTNRDYHQSNIIAFQNKLYYSFIHESPEYRFVLADKTWSGEYSQKIISKNICIPI